MTEFEDLLTPEMLRFGISEIVADTIYAEADLQKREIIVSGYFPPPKTLAAMKRGAVDYLISESKFPEWREVPDPAALIENRIGKAIAGVILFEHISDLSTVVFFRVSMEFRDDGLHAAASHYFDG